MSMVYCTLHRVRGRLSFSNISYLYKLQTIAYNNYSCRRHINCDRHRNDFLIAFHLSDRQLLWQSQICHMATTASYIYILYLLIMALNIIHLLTIAYIFGLPSSFILPESFAISSNLRLSSFGCSFRLLSWTLLVTWSSWTSCIWFLRHGPSLLWSEIILNYSLQLFNWRFFPQKLNEIWMPVLFLVCSY